MDNEIIPNTIALENNIYIPFGHAYEFSIESWALIPDAKTHTYYIEDQKTKVRSNQLALEYVIIPQVDVD